MDDQYIVNPFTLKARSRGALRKSVIRQTQISESHLADGRPDLAVTALGAAAFLKPNNAELYRRKGEIYIQMCDFKSAYLNFKRALKLSPQDQRLKDRLAGICFIICKLMQEDAEWQKAEQKIDEALVLDTSTRYKIEKTKINIHNGLKKSALQKIDMILKEDPNNFEALILRAKIMVEFRQFLRAKGDLEAAGKIEPENKQLFRIAESIRSKALSLYNEASAHLMNGEHVKSIRNLNASLLANPTADAYRLRATVYRHSKKFDSAIEDLKTAMSIVHSESKGKESASVKELEEIHIQMGVTLNDIGCSLLKMNKVRDAITCFRKAISRNTEAAEFHMNLANCYKQLDEFDNAVKFYTNALDILKSQEGGTDAHQYKKLSADFGHLRFERGRRLFNNTDYERAERELSEAIKLLPSQSEFLLLRGETRLKLSNLVHAYLDFENATKANPDSEAASQRFLWLRSKINPSKALPPRNVNCRSRTLRQIP
eukprot:jgi/Bigna1/71293/fgenesh1_pg.15_\